MGTRQLLQGGRGWVGVQAVAHGRASRTALGVQQSEVALQFLLQLLCADLFDLLLDLVSEHAHRSAHQLKGFEPCRDVVLGVFTMFKQLLHDMSACRYSVCHDVFFDGLKDRPH